MIELVAENVKRLRAVAIRPTTNVVEIQGRNAQGKTSVLDALFWALAGARQAQDRPIRDGQTEARIRLDLAEIVVTRKFREQESGRVTTSLAVESADGARFKSPQRLLDDLLGSLSFDPLAFLRAQPREQFETLAAFVSDLDVAEFEGEQEHDYELRRVANREAKRARAAADAVIVPEDAPEAPVSLDELTSKLRDAEAANADRAEAGEVLARKRQQIESHRGTAKRERERIESLKAEALKVKAAMDDRLAWIEKAEAEVAATKLPERVDTAPILNAMSAAGDRNQAYEKRRRWRELSDEAAAQEKAAQVIDNRMNERKRAFEAAVASADMPVPGVSLDDGTVHLHGVPLAQASDAEQLRVSCGVAMRQNADLRVLRIRDGSLLDAESMDVLREMADANDYQVWIERVADAADGVGFFIEAGAVAEEPGA